MNIENTKEFKTIIMIYKKHADTHDTWKCNVHSTPVFIHGGVAYMDVGKGRELGAEALLLFAGSGHAASSRLALNENRHTLNIAFPRIMGVICICLALAGCNTTNVKISKPVQIVLETVETPEDQLLDVGIGIFDPGVDSNGEVQEDVFPGVRKAEARYIPNKLVETVAATGAWGAVRVIPNHQSEVDVWVDGKIIKSNGEALAVVISVKDASGKIWYRKQYAETANKNTYNDRKRRTREPFQNLYNRIANDMLAYRINLNTVDIKTIRTITELKFAQRFAPEVFDQHLGIDSNGFYYIKRLPADNDPILQRIKRIHDRDFVYVDTVQEYHGAFVREMEEPYLLWREESYHEYLAKRELKQESALNLLGGVIAVVASVAAIVTGCGSTDPNLRSLCQLAGTAGAAGGALLVKRGLDKREQVKIHELALQELGESLDADVEPRIVKLEDRTVTLTGTVEEQYDQWQQILKEMYLAETGRQGS